MAQQFMLGPTGDLEGPFADRPRAARSFTTLTEIDPDPIDISAMASGGAIELVEGEGFAPYDLSAAGFRSLSSLVGSGKVIYRGVRDDHHVFEHASGARYEPVSRLRRPGPRRSISRITLQLDCGALIATFTDTRHVWVSAPPAGLSVAGSAVSFSFHYHRAADGRWVESAWDPDNVRSATGFLARAPLAALRDIAENIVPAISAGLADLSAAQPGSAEKDAQPLGSGTFAPFKRPSISASAVTFNVRLTRRLTFITVIALAMVSLGKTTLLASTLASVQSTIPSGNDAAPGPLPGSPPPPERSPPYRPSADPAVDATTVPTQSGTGRRIVYCNKCQRVWLVEADNSALRSYQVSGRRGVPHPGTYSVQSRSNPAGSLSGMRLDHMVRFARGRSLWIGFHAIPVGPKGPIQTRSQLGQPLSSGCIRQDPADAEALWKFAPTGTPVVVLA